MNKKILLEVEINWPDEEDYNTELILEDSGILSSLKEGVTVKIIE